MPCGVERMPHSKQVVEADRATPCSYLKCCCLFFWGTARRQLLARLWQEDVNVHAHPEAPEMDPAKETKGWCLGGRVGLH